MVLQNLTGISVAALLGLPAAMGFLDALLAIHVCAILGYVLNDVIADAGLKLPLFVTCPFAGILVTNLIPRDEVRAITGTKGHRARRRWG